MGDLAARGAEGLRRRFALLPALGLVLGVALGYGVAALDERVDVGFAPFRAADAAAAQSALSTLATSTLTVAGISFSVTLVALQLASTQLSPRVLGTFREDLVVQGTLGAFLAVFSYSLVVTGRLSADDPTPEIALSVALVGGLGALGLFVAFVGRTVAGLQSSTVVRRIDAEGRRAVATRHPVGVGEPAADGVAAAVRARGEEVVRSGGAVPLRARCSGYLRHLEPERLLRVAGEHDAVVVQERPVGSLVLQGEVVGWAVGEGLDGDAADALEAAFVYGEERTMHADVAFPVRSLADVALRALSPSLNDPTTALNAMGAATDTILAVVAAEPVEPVRVDAAGDPRLVGRPATVDELVRVGFEELSRYVDEAQPVVARQLADWLDLVAARAADAGLEVPSAADLADRLRATARGDERP